MYIVSCKLVENYNQCYTTPQAWNKNGKLRNGRGWTVEIFCIFFSIFNSIILTWKVDRVSAYKNIYINYNILYFNHTKLLFRILFRTYSSNIRRLTGLYIHNEPGTINTGTTSCYFSKDIIYLLCGFAWWYILSFDWD